MNLDELGIPETLRKFEIADNGCWIWHGRRHANGYASGTSYKMRKGTPGRLMWEVVNGRHVAPGMVLGYSCFNGSSGCVNPFHLDELTKGENLARNPNTLNGQQLRKPYCKHGHEYTPENTLILPETHRRAGARICKACCKRRARAAAVKHRDEYRRRAREKYATDPRVRRMQYRRHRTAQRKRKAQRIAMLRYQGRTVSEACRIVGIDRTTYYYWQSRYEWARFETDLDKLPLVALERLQEQDKLDDEHGKGWMPTRWDTSLDRPVTHDSATTWGELVAAPVESVEEIVLRELERDKHELALTLLEFVEAPEIFDPDEAERLRLELERVRETGRVAA